MRSHTGYFLIALSIFFWIPEAFAQNDSIKTTSREKFESYINEKYYTRIPVKDFDEMLENKVVSKINDKFTFWVTVIGIFIGAIGGLAAYAFNNKIKQMIIEQTRSQGEKEFQKINEYIRSSKKYILRSELEVLKNRFDLNPSFESNIPEAKSLLLQIKEQKDLDLLAEIIDLVAVMYYQNRNPKEIDKLIQKYEKECDIKETTYMNAAILYSDLYELDGAKWYRDVCMKYCRYASEKIPHYGEPKGIMLLIYAIDYVRSQDQKEKEQWLKEAKGLINEILSGSSPFTAYNTVKRLAKDNAQQAFRIYLEKLELAIPVELKKLYETARQYEERYVK